jgi:hypothetical protein
MVLRAVRLPVIVAANLGLIPEDGSSASFVNCPGAAIPISIGMAVARYRLLRDRPSHLPFDIPFGSRRPGGVLWRCDGGGSLFETERTWQCPTWPWPPCSIGGKRMQAWWTGGSAAPLRRPEGDDYFSARCGIRVIELVGDCLQRHAAVGVWVRSDEKDVTTQE